MPKAERDVAINKIRESLHQLQRDPNSVFFSERYAKTPTGNSKVPNLKSKLRKWMSMENLNAKADDKLDSAIQNMGGNSDISKHRRRHSERAGAVESHDDETSSVRSSRSHVKKSRRRTRSLVNARDVLNALHSDKTKEEQEIVKPVNDTNVRFKPIKSEADKDEVDASNTKLKMDSEMKSTILARTRRAKEITSSFDSGVVIFSGSDSASESPVFSNSSSGQQAHLDDVFESSKKRERTRHHSSSDIPSNTTLVVRKKKRPAPKPPCIIMSGDAVQIIQSAKGTAPKPNGIPSEGTGEDQVLQEMQNTLPEFTVSNSANESHSTKTKDSVPSRIINLKKSKSLGATPDKKSVKVNEEDSDLKGKPKHRRMLPQIPVDAIEDKIRQIRRTKSNKIGPVHMDDSDGTSNSDQSEHVSFTTSTDTKNVCPNCKSPRRSKRAVGAQTQTETTDVADKKASVTALFQTTKASTKACQTPLECKKEKEHSNSPFVMWSSDEEDDEISKANRVSKIAVNENNIENTELKIQRPPLHQIVQKCNISTLVIQRENEKTFGVKVFETFLVQPEQVEPKVVTVQMKDGSLKTSPIMSPKGKRPAIGLRGSAFTRVSHAQQGNDLPMVAVFSLDEDCEAKKDGRLQEGDFILEVNQIQASSASVDDIQRAIDSEKKQLMLVIARNKDDNKSQEEIKTTVPNTTQYSHQPLETTATDQEKELAQLKQKFNQLEEELREKEGRIADLEKHLSAKNCSENMLLDIEDGDVEDELISAV